MKKVTNLLKANDRHQNDGVCIVDFEQEHAGWEE